MDDDAAPEQNQEFAICNMGSLPVRLSKSTLATLSRLEVMRGLWLMLMAYLIGTYSPPIVSRHPYIHVQMCSDVKTTTCSLKRETTVKSQLHFLFTCQSCTVGISDMSEAFCVPGKESW